MSTDIEVITKKEDIKRLTGLNLYKETLKEKLDVFKEIDKEVRANWTIEDLDKYIRNLVTEEIVTREFEALTPISAQGGFKKRLGKKEIILNISKALNFPLMSIAHIYGEIETEFFNGYSFQDNSKDFIVTNIYNQLTDIDILLNGLNPEDKQYARTQAYLLAQKLKWMEFLAKMEKLTEKASANVLSIGGNMSVSTSTTVDKQINVSESDKNKILFSLMKDFIQPSKDVLVSENNE